MKDYKIKPLWAVFMVVGAYALPVAVISVIERDISILRSCFAFLPILIALVTGGAILAAIAWVVYWVSFAALVCSLAGLMLLAVEGLKRIARLGKKG